MIGADLLKAERAIYYTALDILQKEKIPEDLWALIIDSAAGRIKDHSLTRVAMEQLDWRQRALEAKGAEVASDEARQRGDVGGQ